MPNYQNGKIYEITSPSTNMKYIGSTVCPLRKRFNEHKSSFNKGLNTGSRDMFLYDDCKITLLENFPCNSKTELVEREQFYMDKNGNNCLNKRGAFISIDKRKENDKKYNQNRDKQKQRDWNNKYYHNNLEKERARKKKYRDKNKEKKAVSDKKYRDNNRDKILAQKQQYYDWERSWGGDRRYNNNPLAFHKDLFS